MVLGSLFWHHRSVPADRQSGFQRGAVAFALRDPLPWPAFAGLVGRAESLGYRAVFLPEIAGRDAFAALAALAGETSALALATGVVAMRSRTPMHTAMAGATVQERSGGRLVLGLGTGPATAGALAGLRSLVVGLRRLLRDGEATIDEHTIRLSLAIPRPPPLWIAALGPSAMRLAGEVADGVILNWCTPERVAEARIEIAEGASAAGRNPADVTIAVYVRAALGEGRSSSEAALKAAVAEYASYPAYARQFARMGLGDDAEHASRARREGRATDVADRLVEAVCLTGPPAAARERLDRYRDQGADLPVVYPVAGIRRRSSADAIEEAAEIRQTLEGLAPGV